MSPTISVALCTFNGERFIAEQIDSILAQTRLPEEIVLSDDASTDATVGIVEDAIGRFIASNTDRSIVLRVIRNPAALGVVRNFEQAVSATTGDLIILCDQDDRWAVDRVARALEVFEDHPDWLLVHGDANLIDESGASMGDSLFGALAITGRERAQIRSGDGLAALLGRNVVTGATTMFRRGLITAALPFPADWVHDEWLAVIAAAIGRVDLLPVRIIDYRQHGANAIGARRLGLAAKLNKLREPRDERNRIQVNRASELVERLESLGSAVSPGNLDRARSKLVHERSRLGLPSSYPKRIPVVLRELVAGGYSRYGRGMQDALRDLVQPAR